MTSAARLFAVFIAAVTLAALIAQSVVTSRLPEVAGPARLIWTLAAYFTVLTNVIVTVTFVWVTATGRTGTAGWHGGLLLWIGTVGLIYHAVLAGLWAPVGLAWWADQGLHTATPVLVLLWWLIFAPKAPLTWVHPWRWVVWPLAYCLYALLRGQLTGIYPYPFIDVSVLGAARTALNVAGLTLAFLVGGYGLIGGARLLRGQAGPS